MLVGSCHTLAAWLRGAPWLDTYTRSPLRLHATRSGMLHGQGSIATSIRSPTFAHPPIARTATSAILHGQKRLGETAKEKENLDGSSVWASLAFGSSAGCSCCADEDCWPPAAALSASKAALASIAANSALSAAQRLGVPGAPLTASTSAISALAACQGCHRRGVRGRGVFATSHPSNRLRDTLPSFSC